MAPFRSVLSPLGTHTFPLLGKEFCRLSPPRRRCPGREPRAECESAVQSASPVQRPQASAGHRERWPEGVRGLLIAVRLDALDRLAEELAGPLGLRVLAGLPLGLNLLLGRRALLPSLGWASGPAAGSSLSS